MPKKPAALADEIAPEHLHIATENAAALAEKIMHAGAIFLGNYTPVALGDYAAGPSHVLPTSGTARFASGLSSNDFLRAGSVLHFTREGLDELAPDVRVLATKEGLTGASGQRGDKDEGNRDKAVGWALGHHDTQVSYGPP